MKQAVSFDTDPDQTDTEKACSVSENGWQLQKNSFLAGFVFQCDEDRVQDERIYIYLQYILYIRVQWFSHFFTKLPILTHPCVLKDPRVQKIPKKRLSLLPFGSNFFLLFQKSVFSEIFKTNFLSHYSFNLYEIFRNHL